MPLKIGLTGGIACGKSFCEDFLRARGIDVIDADRVARDVVAPGSPALRELCQVFGEDLLDEQGVLRRALLRERAFAHAHTLAQLNAITHPRIRQAIREQLACVRSAPYVVLSAALLIENKLLNEIDSVVVIDLDEATQWQRAVARDGRAGNLRAIIAAQCSRAERLQQAHFIINNSGSFAATAAQLQQLHARLLQLSAFI